MLTQSKKEIGACLNQQVFMAVKKGQKDLVLRIIEYFIGYKSRCCSDNLAISKACSFVILY